MSQTETTEKSFLKELGVGSAVLAKTTSLEIVNLRLNLAPIWQLIGYAQSADHSQELPMAWRKKLVDHARNAEKLLNEAFNG